MHWMRAQTFSHKKDFESSLKRLDKIEKLTSGDVQPMGGIYAEYATLRGHVLDGVGETQQAIELLQSGVRSARHSSNYNDDEKDYIQAYASIEHPDLSPPLKEVDEQMLEDIQLGNVRMEIKLCLPLFTHPRWPHPDQIGLDLDEDDDYNNHHESSSE
ncbi:MAG TPA: hypothetical protein ENJ32_00640 [Crenotrichaceae bacterium]|nr:hypothetical protein [Crenotrichaceae bacterium]